MTILTKIHGIPLYSNTKDAMQWAKTRGLSSYHVHHWKRQIGYMGGTNHSQARTSHENYMSAVNARRTTTTRRATTTRQTSTAQTTSTQMTGGSGGY
tara:strand:+ start:100 stop:390 length:291 start_codon:yes stop_codon:yes gene_type:complete